MAQPGILDIASVEANHAQRSSLCAVSKKLELPRAARSEDPFDLEWPLVPDDGVVCFQFHAAGEEGLFTAAERAAGASELARAGRFAAREDAFRHLAGRVLARRLLSRQAGCRLEEFEADGWGKPEWPGSGLHFSISHSGREIWLAATRMGSVGIDVEQVNDDVDCLDLAGMFHPEEFREIREEAEERRRAAFFRCWTRKEAVIKALGQGLSIPLDRFCVDTASVTENWLRRLPAGTESSAWTTADLPAEPGYSGAVAVAAADARLLLWRHRLGA